MLIALGPLSRKYAPPSAPLATEFLFAWIAAPVLFSAISFWLDRQPERFLGFTSAGNLQGLWSDFVTALVYGLGAWLIYDGWRAIKRGE